MESENMSVATLQLQCLYSLAARFEEYSSQTLALLPVALRHQLLLHLPVRDVCQLEGDTVFMNGMDPDSIWRDLLQERMALEGHPSAKDVYMSAVSRCLMIDVNCQPSLRDKESKSERIAYLLFGIPLECELTPHSFIKIHKSLRFTWLIPQRYEGEIGDGGTESMVEMFLSKFKWYPKRLDLNEYNFFDDAFRFGNSKVFQSFMSHVESVYVHLLDNHYDAYGHAKSLRSLWLALAGSKPSSFTSVTFLAGVTTLGDYISNLLEILFPKAKEKISDERDVDNTGMNEDEDSEIDADTSEDEEIDYNSLYKFGSLRKLELLVEEGSCGYTDYLSPHLQNLVPFIDFQTCLETLVIDGFSDVEILSKDDRYYNYPSIYDEFYNYLPHLFSKQSFKYLRVQWCTIPVNTVETIIATFLSTPTSHDQTLVIRDCDIVAECTDTYPEYPLVKPVGNLCVSGEYKSLTIEVASPLFLPQWLSNLQLKQLEIKYRCFTCYYARAFLISSSASIMTLCYEFFDIRYHLANEEVQGITKCLELPSLAEVAFFRCHNRKGVVINGSKVEIKEEDTNIELLLVLTSLFSRPFHLISLRRLTLHQFKAYDGELSGDASFRSFFDALFSMPKEQLAEFTLDLRDNECFDYTLQQELVKAWRANSQGQKLKMFIFESCPTTVVMGSSIFELLSDIAVNCDIS